MSQFYRFQLGTFNCVVLRDNSNVMPLAKIFPKVAEAQLQEALAACGIESAEVNVAFDLLYIHTGSQQVLIDTGLPAARGGSVQESMAAAGIDPAEIDTILITHGDGDHIGGMSNFANARFAMPPKAWELWTNEENRAGMVNEFVAVFKHIIPDEKMLAAQGAGREIYGAETLPSLSKRIDLVEPETNVLPGFQFVAAPGHRSDHFAVEITSGDQTLLHIVDGFRHPIQVLHPEWSSFVDSYPEQTVTTIKQLLERAVATDALVFGAHMIFPGLGRIRQTEAGFAWEAAS